MQLTTDLELVHCILDAADGVHVAVVGLVADVALRVYLSGRQAQYFIDLHTQQRW